MFFQLVKPEDIFDRLNSEAYSPEHIECARVLRESGIPLVQLGDLASKPINNSIRAVTGELDAPNASIPMFRPADISGGFADPATAPKLTQEFESEHQKSRVYPGDIVLGIAGTVGCVGRVPPGVRFGNINGSSARIATEHDSISAYLLAYLQSRFGQSSLLRYGVGSVQKHLNLEDLPRVAVCSPEGSAQRYIGGKVQHAERLRSWAGCLEKSVLDAFAELSENPIPGKLSWRTGPEALDSYRINPKHYDPVVLDLLERARRKGTRLEPLADLFSERDIAGGATPKGAKYFEHGIFFARVQNVKPLRLDLSDAAYIDQDSDDELARSRCNADDIILSITGYPGTASLVTSEDLPVNINQHSVRFGIKKGVGAAYVCAALNSRFLKYQVDRLAIGGTRDALDYPSVCRLLIPRLDAETERAVDETARDYVAALKLAQRLTVAARALVEALIEGVIEEQQLVNAQQRLEAGDDQPDRGILARLKADGLDGDGPPLFADLDGLYELLDQATQG